MPKNQGKFKIFFNFDTFIMSYILKQRVKSKKKRKNITIKLKKGEINVCKKIK